MSIISVDRLTKLYEIPVRTNGFKGVINHFFNRKFKKIKAIDNIGFNIDPGEIVGFIGPNGAGKTTTLKVLCGLIHPTSGYLTVLDYLPHKRKNDFRG